MFQQNAGINSEKRPRNPGNRKLTQKRGEGNPRVMEKGADLWATLCRPGEQPVWIAARMMSQRKKKSDGLPDVSEHIEKRNALLTKFGEN